MRGWVLDWVWLAPLFKQQTLVRHSRRIALQFTFHTLDKVTLELPGTGGL